MISLNSQGRFTAKLDSGSCVFSMTSSSLILGIRSLAPEIWEDSSQVGTCVFPGGCRNKVPQTGRLKRQNFSVLEVQSPGLGRATFPLKPLERILPRLSSFRWLPAVADPTSASVVTWPATPCVCTSVSLFALLDVGPTLLQYDLILINYVYADLYFQIRSHWRFRVGVNF